MTETGAPVVLSAPQSAAGTGVPFGPGTAQTQSERQSPALKSLQSWTKAGLFFPFVRQAT